MDKAVAWCQAQTGKELAPSQQAALRQALSSRALVLTGGPGLGKTMLVNTILLSRMLVAESQPRRAREPEVRQAASAMGAVPEADNRAAAPNDREAT